MKTLFLLICFLLVLASDSADEKCKHKIYETITSNIKDAKRKLEMFEKRKILPTWVKNKLLYRMNDQISSVYHLFSDPHLRNLIKDGYLEARMIDEGMYWAVPAEIKFKVWRIFLNVGIRVSQVIKYYCFHEYP